jgi:hypothetical protein
VTKVEGDEKEDKPNVNTESVICGATTRGSIDEVKGVPNLSRRRREGTIWMSIILIAMLAITVILIIPFIKETDIHIQIGNADNIVNVLVETTTKPLISYLFPASYPLGAYRLNVTIVMLGQTVANFTILNVPIGEYVIAWQNNIPAHGLYTITIQLYNLQGLLNTSSINISF